ncbi:MAG: ABC transporter ATP-binding protein [Clostridia bacterium]|nr:ABC transporter ATP-binding protein [Clostridia bacterium]
MIKIDGLKKTYDGFKLDISLEIPEGQVTGIIGRNGAGKSTTIKSLLGLRKIDGGKINILGKNVDELTNKDKENIGVVLSDSFFSLELNLNDVNRILKKTYKDYDEKFFNSICKDQGLPMDKKLRDFSTGMKAKAKVITAISHKTKILVLDEPTAGLDVIARNEVLDLLRKYMEEDPTRIMLITSHISSDLEGICDDLYFIEGGKVVLHEDTDVILGAYGLIKASEEDFAKLDKEYILASSKTKFGYEAITKEKKFYMENYPNLVIENIGIDEVITHMTKKV